MKIEYNNLYIHLIIITKNREPYIDETIRERIEKYITGIVNNTCSKLYAIYANPEHIHMLISKSPKITEEELANVISQSTKKFIKDTLLLNKFEFQESCAAFSVSKSDVDKVCKYIQKQPEHHKKLNFTKEYEQFTDHYQKTLKWEIR